MTVSVADVGPLAGDGEESSRLDLAFTPLTGLYSSQEGGLALWLHLPLPLAVVKSSK